jgi:hypothetical protein
VVFSGRVGLIDNPHARIGKWKGLERLGNAGKRVMKVGKGWERSLQVKIELRY